MTLLLLDWQLALVTFAVVPPLVVVMVWWAKHAKDAFVKVRIKVSALYGTLAENVSGVRAIQSMSREDENSRRFDRLNQENRNANIWARHAQRGDHAGRRTGRGDRDLRR